jgi:putative ABC transport system permease protein
MMRLGEVLRLVFINILENKFKMMLTSLGIIVGAATIVLVIAIGQGSRADVADQFKNLNAGAIDVAVGTGIDSSTGMPEGMGAMPGGAMPGFGGGNMPSFSGGAMPNFSAGAMQPPSGGNSGANPFSAAFGGGGASRAATNRQNNTRLSTEDVADIRELVPGLEEVTILQSGETTIFGGGLSEEQNASVVGVLPEYQYVSNLTPLYGRFIEADDESYADYVCVIGYGLAAQVFTYPAYAYGDYLEIDGKT